MASQAQTSFGVRLKSDGIYTAEVVSITPPSWKSETIDVTNHDSAGRMAEFIGGMRSSDDVKIAGNFIINDAGQVKLMADQADGLVHAYTIEFPTAWGASFDFNCVVTTFAIDDFLTKGDAVGFTALLKVSGAVALNTTLSAGVTTPFIIFNAVGITVPALNANVFEYINTQLTAATSVTVAVTAVTGSPAITLTTPAGDSTLTSGVASSAIALGGAASVTNIFIKVKEAAKVAKVYTVHILRS